MTDPRHLEILAFLEEESALLDADDLTGWLGVLAPDIVYRAPVRTTRDHRTRGVFEPDMYLFNENIMTLMMKIMRMTQTDSAWAENPLSRTHRIVHKIRAYRTDMPDEYEVHSSVLLLRSRYDDPKLETLPARRVDIIRTGEEWKIASRTVFSIRRHWACKTWPSTCRLGTRIVFCDTRNSGLCTGHLDGRFDAIVTKVLRVPSERVQCTRHARRARAGRRRRRSGGFLGGYDDRPHIGQYQQPSP